MGELLVSTLYRESNKREAEPTGKIREGLPYFRTANSFGATHLSIQCQ